MTAYIVTRNWDATEWSLTELIGHEKRRPDIFTAEDGVRMRKVLTFDAPSWEDAHRVFRWAHQELRRSRRDIHLSWEEARILLNAQDQEQLCLFGPSRGRPTPTLRLVTAKS